MDARQARQKIRDLASRVDTLVRISNKVNEMAQTIRKDDANHPSLLHAIRVIETIVTLIESHVEEAKLYSSYILKVPPKTLVDRFR